VNRAARVGAAGHGGQTLISKATHDDSLSLLGEAGAIVSDLGEHRLKGLSRPEHIYQVLPPSLAERIFPKLKTLDEVPTNLPFQTTVFVGRRREWNEICDLIKQDKTSLVTLTGPGGIGKTRLSLRVGSELLEHFPGGVWFADLTEAWSSEAVAASVAAAFDAPITGGESPEKVVASVLEMRKPLLLILDNFEQVVKFASTTVGQWMQRARHVKFLITSRSLLGLSGEREYRLEPLPSPPRRQAGSEGAAVRMSSFDVVRLFVERAREAKPGFSLTDENADDIAQICTSLEGMPLAIELAAARVRIMNPAQMVQKLSQKFQLLRSSRRDLPGRQQSLSGAIDWSYDLLSETERSALCQACVFHGGFFLEAAESVIDLSDQPDAPFAMDVIDALRSHSLLSTVDTEYGPRFRMYNAIREYAEIKLLERMDDLTRDALERRHADHYLQYAEEWDAKRGGEDAVEALDRLEMELENIFYAQDFTERTKDAVGSARAILALAVTMALRGVSAQRIPRLERALAMLELFEPNDLTLRGKVLASLCLACQDIGDWNRAATLADEGLALAERVGEASQIGSALIHRGEMLRLRGATEEALECFTRAEQVFESIGDKGGVGRAVGGLGAVLWKKGEYDEATARFVRAAEIFEKLGNRAGIARNVGGQGIVYAERHDFEAALQCYEQAESMHRLMGNRAAMARTIGNKAIALQEKGDLDAALKCFAEAEAINRELGHKPSVARNIGSRGLVLDEQKQFDQALKCFTDAEAIHREMGNRSGIASNLARRGATMAAQSRWAEAIPPLSEARGIFEQIGEGSTRQAFDCLAVLAHALSETGDHENARVAAGAAQKIAGALGIDASAPDEKTRRALDTVNALAPASG
jgi:predicted ATPase